MASRQEDSDSTIDLMMISPSLPQPVEGTLWGITAVTTTFAVYQGIMTTVTTVLAVY